MTTNVLVVADENTANLIIKILSEAESWQGQDINFRAFTDEDSRTDTDVLIIDSSANVSFFGGPKSRASRGGCWLAAKFRRLGHKGPIILMSFEPARLKRYRDSDSALDTCLVLGGDEIPWFAPMYDLFIRLPIAAQDIVHCVKKAISRLGTRRPLLALAMARASEDYLDKEGSVTDHQWKGFQAVLRFLRGAQCEWMIHADDAMEIIEHIKSEVEKSGTRISPLLVERLQSAVDKQKQRWIEYKAVCEKLGKSPVRYMDLKDKLVYTLLLVDDDCESLGWRLLLSYLLAPDGFNVMADDGLTVEEKIGAKLPVDVVLLDLKLDTIQQKSEDSRGLEGFEVLSKLRSANSYDRNLPVILFTASERMSIERQRQQLGLIGYIVKSEQTEKQDARAYYQRLRTLCRTALDHELRSLLLRLAGRLNNVTPTSFEKIKGKLELGLTELEDPLASCHNAGLAFEKALINAYGPRPKGKDSPKLIDYTEVFSQNIEYPYNEWVDLARLLRNSASHPQLGAGYVNRWDAHLMSMLTIISLYLLEDLSPSDLDSGTVSELLILISRMCGDEIERLTAEHSSLLSEIDLKDRLLEASHLLRLPSQGKDLSSDVKYCIENIKEIASTIVSYLLKYLSIDTPIILLQDGLPVRSSVVVPKDGSVLLTVQTIPEKGGKCVGVSDRAEIQVSSGTDDNQIVIEALPNAGQYDEAQCEITFNADDGTSTTATLRVRVDELKGWAKASSVIIADDQGSFEWTPPLASSALLNDFNSAKKKNVVISLDNASGKVTGVLRQGKARGQFSVQATSAFGLTKMHRCDVLLARSAKKQDALMWRSILFRGNALKEGFDHTGIIGHAYLKSGHFLEMSDVPEDLEDICLSLVALTRFVSWALDVFLTFPNPEFQEMLKSGGISSSIPPSRTMSEPPEITEFTDAVKASGTSPIIRAGLTGFGDVALQLLAQRVVLDRQLKEFRQRSDISQRSADTLRTRKDLIKTRLEQISQEVKEKSDAVGTKKNEMEKLTQQSDILWAKAATMGSNISRQMESQDEALKSLKLEIEQTEGEILQLFEEKESLKVEKDRIEEEFAELQSVIIPLKRMLKGREDIAKNGPGIPDILKLIVEEGAEATLPELEIVEECLRKWVWADERDDLPGLLLDLAELWEQKGAIGKSRMTGDII